MFLKKTTSVFLTQAILFILTVITGAMMARWLGPDGKGQVALLITMIGMISLLSNVGVGAASIYYLNRDQYAHPAIASSALTIQMGLTLSVVVIVWFLSPWLAEHVLNQEISISLLWLSLIFVPVMTLTSVANSLLLGIGEVGKYNYAGLFLKSMQLVLLIIFLVWLNLGITGAVMSIGLSAVFAAGYGVYWLRQNDIFLKLDLSPRWSKPLISYGLKAWIGNLLQYFNYRFDLYIVNYFLGTAQVGQYSVAVAMATIIWYIPNAVSTVLFPKTASDWDTATQFTPVVARNVVFVTTIMAVGLGLVSLPLIKLLYGNAFVSAYLPLLGLLPGVVFLGVGKVLASDLAGRGKPHYGTWSASTALVLTLVFDLLLIPKIGIVGAAIASSLSYGLSASVLCYLYLRLSGNTLGSIFVLQPDDWKRYLVLLKSSVYPQFIKIVRRF